MMPIETPSKCQSTRIARLEREASRGRLARIACILLVLTLAFAGTAQADHGFDPAFNANYFIDALVTDDSGGAYRIGRKVVVLPNGDFVVAGGMRFPNDPLDPAYVNVALARYSPTGVRVPWSGTGSPYAWFNQEYVVYPNLANGGSGDTRIQFVSDIAHVDGKIYVLVERRYEFAPLDADVKVLVFNDNGLFRDEVVVLGSAAEEFAVAFDVRETGLPQTPVAVTVLGQRDFRDITIAKFVEASSGFLVADTTFNGGSPLQITQASCSSQPVCSVSPEDIARPIRLFSFDQEPIYVLGTAVLNGADRDMIVVRVGANGSVDTSFGNNGRRLIAFDEPFSDLGDFARGIEVKSSDVHSGASEAIWVSGTVNRSCKSGVGIAKLTSSGDLDTSFAGSGRAVFGGSVESGEICAQDARLNASAMTLQAGEIAVTGTTSAPDQGGTQRDDGFLLRVSTYTSALRGLAALPMIQGGNRVGDSYLSGLASAGNGRYVVAGYAFWPGTYESLYISARLWPDDRIFADEFETGAGQPR